MKRTEAVAVGIALLAIAIFQLSCAVPTAEYLVPPSKLGAAPYAAWAHSHWVWLSSFQANQSSETALVEDYLARDIPVGAVDIDSNWSTGFNNFVWDTKKYPNASAMVQHFHSLGVRVILWVTSVINTDSPNYAYGKSKGYYLSGLDGIDTIHWWHGQGAFIDYTNPDALAWWHSQMDYVIDIGIDGWKCDGTDPYVFEMVVAIGYGGIVTEPEYATSYYSDFYFYTKKKNPNALIMSRPVDSYGSLYLSFSPRDVVFSGWVGDQDPTFSGLKDALRNMFHSAWANYVNFGSDIGGYRSGQRTKILFIRWAQLGAFCPLMENGGDNEHRPWKFDNTNETLTIYRNFVHIHYELGPYFLSAGTTAYETGVSVMFPMADWTIFDPDTWDYKLWKDIFVSPMVDNTTTRVVAFPPGDDWVDWWTPSKVYAGGTSIPNYAVPLNQFPVFHRKGSILPLDVKNRYGNHGDERSAAYLTLLISHLAASANQSVREDNTVTNPLAQEFKYEFDGEQGVFTFSATAHSRKLLLLVRGVKMAKQQQPLAAFKKVLSAEGHEAIPMRESLDSLYATTQGWYHDSVQDELWVIPGDSSAGLLLSLEGIRSA